MEIQLNSHNVFTYLLQQQLCSSEELQNNKIELISAKNFNLLVELSTGQKLLVKQERKFQDGKTAGEFLNEWRIQKFTQYFPEITNDSFTFPEVLHFDPDNSIIIFRWLDNYRDLSDFYLKENVFPSKIAYSIGRDLASLHRATFERSDYQDFFVRRDSEDGNSERLNNYYENQVLLLFHRLKRISPEIFGQVPADGLKFFLLYQRFDSLEKAIAELGNALKPCCLTHNDLKLNNILLQTSGWDESGDRIARFIDWERASWGDPAFDLGSLVSSYLQLWLGSLVASKSLSIEESLSLATVPLELIQPSIGALVSAYFDTFSEITKHYPDFLQRVVQCAGFILIQQTQAGIQYQKSFDNTSICMLQVAKSLLCRPKSSISTVLGHNVQKVA